MSRWTRLPRRISDRHISSSAPRLDISPTPAGGARDRFLDQLIWPGCAHLPSWMMPPVPLTTSLNHYLVEGVEP
jgi:hypothetical protein